MSEKDSENFTEAEISQRMARALKRSLQMKPVPHKRKGALRKPKPQQKKNPAR
jgi:hypothetical protein